MNVRRFIISPSMKDYAQSAFKFRASKQERMSGEMGRQCGKCALQKSCAIHVADGSCVTSIAGPNGHAQLYERWGRGPFEVGNQVLTSSHRKLLLSKAMVVSVAETPDKIPAGKVERGERKRTVDEVSKAD